MRRLEFSPEAWRDLDEIADHIATDNPERVLSFLAELEERCAGLLQFPLSATPRPELAPDLRSKPHGRYVIFYTPSEAVVRMMSPMAIDLVAAAPT